jgi:hypothetical protein
VPPLRVQVGAHNELTKSSFVLRAHGRGRGPTGPDRCSMVSPTVVRLMRSDSVMPTLVGQPGVSW